MKEKFSAQVTRIPYTARDGTLSQAATRASSFKACRKMDEVEGIQLMEFQGAQHR